MTRQLTKPYRQSPLKIQFTKDPDAFKRIVPKDLLDIIGGESVLEVVTEEAPDGASWVCVRDKQPDMETSSDRDFLDVSLSDLVPYETEKRIVFLDTNLQDLREPFFSYDDKENAYPGQDHTGLPGNIANEIFSNSLALATKLGYTHIGLHPMHYHTLVFAQQRGFALDPDNPDSKSHEPLIQDLQDYFKREGVKTLRERSWMTHEGKALDREGYPVSWHLDLVDTLFLVKKL